MPQSMVSGLCEELACLNPADPEYAARSVDVVLAAARKAGVSDVHFQPTGNGLELKYRLDGVLTPISVFPAQIAVNIIARLKVLSGLLTYHTDRPQEGRIRLPQDDVECAFARFPLHGERGGTAVRRHSVTSVR